MKEAILQTPTNESLVSTIIMSIFEMHEKDCLLYIYLLW